MLPSSSNNSATAVASAEQLIDEIFFHREQSVGSDKYVAKKERLAPRYWGCPLLDWNTWQKENIKNQDMLNHLGDVMYTYFTHFYAHMTPEDKWSVSALLQSGSTDHSAIAKIETRSEVEQSRCIQDIENTIEGWLEDPKADDGEILSGMKVDHLGLQMSRINMPVNVILGEKVELGCFQWCARVTVTYKPTSGYPRHETVRIVCGAYLQHTIRMVPLMAPGRRTVSIKPGSECALSSYLLSFDRTAQLGMLERFLSDLNLGKSSGDDDATSYTDNTPTISGNATPASSIGRGSVVDEGCGDPPSQVHGWQGYSDLWDADYKQ
jgi:hypothetical protein